LAILFLEKSPGFTLRKKRKLKKWIRETVQMENRFCGDITFVFECDEEVYRINLKYLKHDWYTDVISFDYGEENKVGGDIIISVDRVRENANKYEVSFEKEIRRIMIHGILHLAGYDDGNEEEKKRMTRLEDKYLALWQKMEEQEDGKV